jgi:hypothetical protein
MTNDGSHSCTYDAEGNILQVDAGSTATHIYDGSYDITNPQSFNRYAYALNNPLSFNDPSGLCDPNEQPCPVPPPGGPDPCVQNPLACYGGGSGGNGLCMWFGYCPGTQNNTGGGSAPPKPTPSKGSVAKTVTQNCLAQYNGPTAAKAIQFFSLYNLATNLKNAWADWTVLPALKIVSLKALDMASQAVGNTQFLSVTGGASTEILSPTASFIQAGEGVAGGLVGPGVAVATAVDAAANAGCDTIGRQAAGQVTPLPPGVEVSF